MKMRYAVVLAFASLLMVSCNKESSKDSDTKTEVSKKKSKKHSDKSREEDDDEFESYYDDEEYESYYGDEEEEYGCYEEEECGSVPLETVSGNRVDRVIDEYEELVDELLVLARRAENGDESAEYEALELMNRIQPIAEKLESVADEMTEAQQARLLELAAKAYSVAQ